MRSCIIFLLRLYQLTFAAFLGGRCRFLPSCSHYAIEAVRLHGTVRGGGLAIKRICRCHPLRQLGGGQGYDPVPPLT